MLGPPEAPATVAVPPTTVTWSTAYTQPSENFNGTAWEIHLPAPANMTSAGTLVFATGVEFVLPSTINVAGGATPALYTATFEATVQLLTVDWQFAAISYPPNYLPVDYNALNVVITGPLAGTPQVNPAGAQGPTSVAGPPQTAAPSARPRRRPRPRDRRRRLRLFPWRRRPRHRRPCPVRFPVASPPLWGLQTDRWFRLTSSTANGCLVATTVADSIHFLSDGAGGGTSTCSNFMPGSRARCQRADITVRKATHPRL